jgi:hypothetical protein
MEDESETEELSSGTKGKRGELIVIGELLTRGLQVYLPVVDSGIDCVVDIGGGNYREVQIKYRENTPTFLARTFKPRDNFFVVCWLNDHGANDFWTIPSRVFYESGKQIKVKGRDYIQLLIGREGSTNYNKLADYHHNFGKLLSGATAEVHKAVQRAWKRIEGQHFTQSDYEREILAILAEAKVPLSSKKIVVKIKEKMGTRFSQADLESTSRGRARWESTARFAIYQGLKRRGLIEAKTKNQWVITSKGCDELGSAKD